MDTRTILATPLVLAAAQVCATAQTVWFVDDDQPADFADLPQAYAASSSGDVIVVRPGTYSSLRLDAHGLSLVADPAGEANIEGELLVDGVTEDTFVSGFRLLPEPGDTQPGRVCVEDNTFPTTPVRVWVEDVRPTDGETEPNLFFASVSETVFVRCSNFASDTTAQLSSAALPLADCLSFPQAGFVLRGGVSTLVDCDFVGADGIDGVTQAPGISNPGAPDCGGAAATLTGILPIPNALTVIGSRLTGGRGGSSALVDSTGSSCYSGGPGGSAIRNTFGTFEVHVQDSELVAGLGGEAIGACPVGPVGMPLSSQSVVDLDGLHRPLLVTTGAGATGAQLEFDARSAGAACFFGFGRSVSPSPFAGLEGVVFGPQIGLPQFAGTADPAGQLTTVVPLGLAAGSGETFVVQAGYLVSDPSSGGIRIVLGGADAVTLIP